MSPQVPHLRPGPPTLMPSQRHSIAVRRCVSRKDWLLWSLAIRSRFALLTIELNSLNEQCHGGSFRNLGLCACLQPSDGAIFPANSEDLDHRDAQSAQLKQFA